MKVAINQIWIQHWKISLLISWLFISLFCFLLSITFLYSTFYLYFRVWLVVFLIPFFKEAKSHFFNLLTLYPTAYYGASFLHFNPPPPFIPSPGWISLYLSSHTPFQNSSLPILWLSPFSIITIILFSWNVL